MGSNSGVAPSRWRLALLATIAAVGASVVLATASAAGATGWVIVPTPNPPGAQRSTLSAVSCTSPRACTAVGNSTTSAGGGAALAERWNGAVWEIETTPSLAGAQIGALAGVSCPRANVCVAVGSSSSKALVERWDGRNWAIQSAPDPPGAQVSSLAAVSCTKPNACVAVGSYTPTGQLGQRTLAERWNGRAWVIEQTPNAAGAQDSLLDGVSCRGRRTCTAVGHSFTSGIPNGVTSTLAERWNGRAWAIQATPNPAGAQNTYLYGVSCPTRRACTAVGSSTTSSAVETTLAESWRPARWKIQPTPNPPSGPGAIESALAGVSCPRRGLCTAVGDALTSTGPATLAERFANGAWRIQQTPSAGPFPFLAGVSCPTPRVCLAVGGSGFRSTGATLAERWSP